MNKFILKEVTTNIIKELENIGFDANYKFKACDKFEHKNIKIFDLTVPQANILKQTALIFGADCAVHKEVITGNIEKSDVILCGSYSQLKKIAEKLKFQPFNLKILGENILNFLNENKRKTKLVGILNITDNSFSDGGKYIEPLNAQNHLMKLIEDGVDMIDIGAESTKPYSLPIAPNKQIERLKPIISFINSKNIKIPISIDTRSSIVAEYCLNEINCIINDVSGLDYDKNMVNILSKYNATVILQHSQGTPENMQNNPQYKNVVEDIYLKLLEKINYANENGISNIIIDPGIGFGKTKENNIEILNNITNFYSLNCPVMIGLSRKSFLGVNKDDNELKDSLSLAYSYPLMQAKIDYLRVHNVKLHKTLLQNFT